MASNIHSTPRWWYALLLCLGILFASQAFAAPAQTGPQIFYAGQKALEKGRYVEALRLLRKASKLLPHWGHVHLELAEALQRNGAPLKEIEAALVQAQKLLPSTNPRIHWMMGLFWEGQGERYKALRSYIQAMKWGHLSDKPCLRASKIWLSFNQGKQAIPCLLTLLKKNRSKAEAHHLLAQAYTQDNQVEKAEVQWTLARSYRPLSVPLLQGVYLFYVRFAPTRRGRQRWKWMRKLRRIERRLKRLNPKKRQRKMRMLRPSRR